MISAKKDDATKSIPKMIVELKSIFSAPLLVWVPDMSSPPPKALPKPASDC